MDGATASSRAEREAAVAARARGEGPTRSVGSREASRGRGPPAPVPACAVLGGGRRGGVSAQRVRRRNAVLLGPRREGRQDRRIERDAVRELIAITREPALTRHANAIDAWERLGAARSGRDRVHLSAERAETAECFGIEYLHEGRAGPALGRVRAPLPREPGGQRLRP